MSTTATKFDLRETIRGKISSTDIADPREMADALLNDNDIPKRVYLDVLRLTLPGYVREMMRIERGESILALTEDPAVRPARSGKNNVSKRWAKAKDDDGLFSVRLHTGTRWVVLGDCTKNDLLEAASEYDRRAAENAIFSKRYTTVASLFDQHATAKTVRDLPFEDVAAALR